MYIYIISLLDLSYPNITLDIPIDTIFLILYHNNCHTISLVSQFPKGPSKVAIPGALRDQSPVRPMPLAAWESTKGGLGSRRSIYINIILYDITLY